MRGAGIGRAGQRVRADTDSDGASARGRSTQTGSPCETALLTGPLQTGHGFLVANCIEIAIAGQGRDETQTSMQGREHSDEWSSRDSDWHAVTPESRLGSPGTARRRTGPEEHQLLPLHCTFTFLREREIFLSILYDIHFLAVLSHGCESSGQ